MNHKNLKYLNHENLKYFMSTITIRNGEHETLTNCCLLSDSLESAKKELIEMFDIGGDDWEEQSELYSLVEVTAAEFKVLRKYI
jgi:hypothetical protein